MPKGLRPKAAIDKVFGDFLREGGFILHKSVPSEIYKYRTEQAGVLGKLEIQFNWCEEIALKTLYNPWGYKHFLTIRIRGKSGGHLDRIVMRVKYPHLYGEPDQPYTAEQEEEIKRVKQTDPMLDTEFITQEEMEEKLYYGLQALKEYGIPWLEKKEELLRKQEQNPSNE